MPIGKWKELLFPFMLIADREEALTGFKPLLETSSLTVTAPFVVDGLLYWWSFFIDLDLERPSHRRFDGVS